jgi:hypothetical protein
MRSKVVIKISNPKIKSKEKPPIVVFLRLSGGIFLCESRQYHYAMYLLGAYKYSE